MFKRPLNSRVSFPPSSLAELSLIREDVEMRQFHERLVHVAPALKQHRPSDGPFSETNHEIVSGAHTTVPSAMCTYLPQSSHELGTVPSPFYRWRIEQKEVK